jgi:predicted GIY-YIG superfamily endonuclease
MTEKPWSVYIAKCRDGKLYTGISNDVDKRIAAHNKGKGCRFTRYRYPLQLLYKEECGSKSNARKRELGIQGFTRKKKIELIEKFEK